MSAIVTKLHGHEGPAAKAARLLSEAKEAAREHIAALEAAMNETHRLAVEIRDAGECYPDGVKALARSVAEETASRLQILTAVNRGGGR